MDESPTHNSGIEHSSEFPSSMLTDRDKLDQVRQKLYEAVKETFPDPKRFCPGFEGKNANDAMKKMIDCDEVFPGIILGDGTTARNKKYLKKIGVTHVVNAAHGDAFGFINTDEKFYESEKIKFLGLRVIDIPGAKISIHFDKAADFIEDALASKGKVYVHCVMGVSRSSTIVIAFLMIKRGYNAENALRAVRSKRSIIPNEGFMLQLAHLDLKLTERRNLQVSESPFVSESPKSKKPCRLS